MFVVVSKRNLSPQDNFAELRRYLYSGQSIVSDVVLTEHYGQFLIVEAPDERMGNDLCNRLASGFYFAKPFATKEEAEAEIKTWEAII